MAFAVVLSGLLAAMGAQAADNTPLDPTTLPRLEGAQDNPSPRSSSTSFSYFAPGPVPAVSDATRKLLTADGWTQYALPLEENSQLLFKKGRQGLLVYFTRANGRPDQSNVNYVANHLNTDLPFPASPADVVFDPNRPYLNLVAPGTVDSMLAFFDKELGAMGWPRLSAADAAARWPNATLDGTIENGAFAYYIRPSASYQKPIRLSLQRRADGMIAVEIKVASFALAQDLDGELVYGMPKPKETRGSRATNGRARRELTANMPADVPVVLEFYRRELGKLNWTEEPGAVVNPEEATLTFKSDEGTATLKLSRKYDLTTANVVVQVSEAALAAKAKAEQEASNKFLRDALDMANAATAAAEAQRAAAAAARGPESALRAQADTKTPIPLPDGAEGVEFNGGDGRLEFSSSSSVKALADFYRGALKPLGWQERPSVINNPNMVVMEFLKGGKKISMTALQLGPKVKVTANGSGLVAAGGGAVAANAPAGDAAPKAIENLEAAEPASGLPVPKGYTSKVGGSSTMPGGQTPFRRELDVSVKADLGSVLAFYRRELTKMQWKELPQGELVRADKASLAFTSPDGPAILKLGRSKGETSVSLAVKNPAEATKAGVMPAAGQARLLFGNLGDDEAVITISGKTIKIPPNTAGPKGPKGPVLDVKPGKYKYSLKVAGRSLPTEELEANADDAWGLLIGPGDGGVLAMQVY